MKHGKRAHFESPRVRDQHGLRFLAVVPPSFVLQTGLDERELHLWKSLNLLGAIMLCRRAPRIQDFGGLACRRGNAPTLDMGGDLIRRWYGPVVWMIHGMRKKQN